MNTVYFEKGMNIASVYGFYQWDYGQMLEIKGVETNGNVCVQFYLDQSGGNAVPVVTEVKEDSIIAEIPSFVFEKETTRNYNAYAFVYVSDENSGETVKVIKLNIKARPKPEDYVYTEEEKRRYDSLEERIEYLEENGTGGSNITVDSELLETSENPVQNKVVTEKVNALSEEIDDYTVEGKHHLNLNDEIYVSGSIQDNGEELDSYYGAFKGMNYIPIIGSKTIEMYSETTSDIYIAQYDYRYKFISRTRLYSRNNAGDVVKSLTLDAETRYIKVYRYTGTASEKDTAKISVYYSENAKNEYVPYANTEDCTYVDFAKVAGIEKNVHLFNCVQSMKSDGKLKDGDLCVTLGYYTENDGGGAKYLISSTANNNNDVHQERLINGLYATLMHDGTINVKQLGAYGNNTKDDSASFQKAFNLATKSVEIPTGNYLLKTSVLVQGKTNFVVHAEKSTIRYDETSGYCFKFTNIHNSDFYFGRIIGRNSNGCIELYSESNNTSVAYLNIYFQQFYSDTNCVYAHCGGENTQGGYIAEIRFFNGKVQSYTDTNYGVGFKIDNAKQNTMDHYVFTNIGIEGIHTGFYFIGAEEQVEDTGGKGIVEACEVFGFRAMEAFKILLKTDGLVRNTQFTTASYMYSRYFDVSEKTYGIKLNAPIMNTGGTRVAYSALIDNGAFIPFVEDDNTYHNITPFEEYDLNNSEDSFDTIYKYFLVNSTNKSLKLTNQYGVHSGRNKFYVKMDGIHDNGFTIFDYEGNVIFNNTLNLQAPCLLLFEWIENIGWLVTKVDTLTNVI